MEVAGCQNYLRSGHDNSHGGRNIPQNTPHSTEHRTQRNRTQNTEHKKQNKPVVVGWIVKRDPMVLGEKVSQLLPWDMKAIKAPLFKTIFWFWKGLELNVV